MNTIFYKIFIYLYIVYICEVEITLYNTAEQYP